MIATTAPTLRAEATPDRPQASEAAFLRGPCPACGEPLVSECYYIKGRGFLVLYVCSACDYRRTI